jgi:uncharacterized protein YndB with AHSA1/START domain
MSQMTTEEKSNEIRIIRVYDAPIEAVWDAWTETERVSKWWGPRGFTLTNHHLDLRPGGTWRYTMHGPDGTDYENTMKYLEVERPRKLVYDHGGHEDRPPMFRVTVLFTDLGGKTRMEMTSTLPSPEALAETRKIIRKAGGDSTWDRLSEFLGKQIDGKEKFVINRSFDVPLERMFAAWTIPSQLANWMAPNGFKMEMIESDIRSGGSSFYVMTGPNGAKMYGKAKYLSVQSPHRLVYAQQFCDEKGRVSRHPMSPTWPETMLTSIGFTAEGPERTRVSLTWVPEANCTAEEVETFAKARSGMTQGWTGSFDHLEAFFSR